MGKWILGLDIGGANTKSALIKVLDSRIIESISHIEYFPFWESNMQKFSRILSETCLFLVKDKNIRIKDIDFITIAITAELSDAFQTKREGIRMIMKALTEIFEPEKMFFISTLNKFLNYEEALDNYPLISAANWVSTALYLGKFIPNCILIDAGSTTIDLIPILKTQPVSTGKADLERLIHHELIYTGGLRATIPSITHFVMYKGQKVRISFEKFALISDVHRILNNISEAEYINDTADNRSKSLNDCYARLSRIICADLEGISVEELDLIARYIYEQQLNLISEEIQEFMHELLVNKPKFKNHLKFVITGLASKFLIEVVLNKLGYNDIQAYEDVTLIPDRVSSSAYAVAGTFFHYNLLSQEVM